MPTIAAYPGPKPWITRNVVRGKHPAADLKRTYARRLGCCTAASAALLVLAALLFPRFEPTPVVRRMIDPVIIVIDDIPETLQEEPPEPVADLPGAEQGLAAQDTVTKPEVDIDFLASMDLSTEMPRGMELDEETVSFWNVSREPVLIKEVMPDYPAEARHAGLEGTVFVKFAVASNGQVKQASVLKGPEIFREPALRAVYQFQFIPAMQNEKPVAVWMTLPIRFQLLDHYDPAVILQPRPH